MYEVRKLALFIDRTHQQWIIRDPDGDYWTVPFDDSQWDRRQPFHPDPNKDIELEPIPAHYRYSLGLPF